MGYEGVSARGFGQPSRRQLDCALRGRCAANSVVDSIIYWLLLLFFLLVGIATYRAGEVGRERGLLSPGLVRLTRLVAAVYGLAALAHLLAGLTSVPGAADAYQLAVVVGGTVLAPLWAFWVGLALHRGARVWAQPEGPPREPAGAR